MHRAHRMHTTLRTEHKRERERALFDNLLVRIHLIVEMIWWTGLAPWEFELEHKITINTGAVFAPPLPRPMVMIQGASN